MTLTTMRLSHEIAAPTGKHDGAHAPGRRESAAARKPAPRRRAS
jgi:hypothetical protein